MPIEDSNDALLERLGRTEDWSIAGRDFREIFSEFYPLILQYFTRHGFGEEDGGSTGRGEARPHPPGDPGAGLAPGICRDPQSPLDGLNNSPRNGV